MAKSKRYGLDFIGDIHGYGFALLDLLRKLGYQKKHDSFQHPEGRRVIFLGDYVDRGPQVALTLETVRSMIDADNALAIMGNHEFNAVCFQTPDGKGDYLRSHHEGNGKNVRQHQSTLDQFSDNEWNEWIDWFRSLPFYIDSGDWRAVHASWDFDSIEKLRGQSLQDEDFLYQSSIPTSWQFSAVENVLKGLEVKLPDGIAIKDFNGIDRSSIRVRWWEGGFGKKYSDLVFPSSDRLGVLEEIKYLGEDWRSYSIDEPPVFFGHYWIPPDSKVMPVGTNVACMDYSVASPGGKLTAYRWDGENQLSSKKFIQVEV